jgi:putative ABC transport system permease protein
LSKNFRDRTLGQLGFQNVEEAIGTSIYWGPNKCEVVGVIDDFHQQSMKSNLEPILLTANYGPNLSFKLGKSVNSDNIASSISMIQNEWKSFFPDNPFDYFFLDDFYSKQYSNDKQVINLFHFFCGLAILISGLGLFGLSSFTARQRTREMSIRKVLGAPTMNLITLLTREFLALVLISSTLAIPLSYFGIMQWLNSFAYHINLSVWYFIGPVLFILFIAFLTIIFQTLRTISANPIETLKYE